MSKSHLRTRLYCLTVLLACGLVTGCSIGGKSRPSSFYLLTALPEGTPSIVPEGESVPTLGLGQIAIPAFLDRPQMVTQVAPNEINLSEFNRWGEPFQDGITRVFRENLVVLLGGTDVSAFPWLEVVSNDYAIHMVVLNFDAATYANEVRLRAAYRITTPKQKQEIVRKEQEFRRPIQADDSYRAIAESMSLALEDLSRAIAAEVIALPEPGKTP